MSTQLDIDNRFTYHSPNPLQAELHEKIRGLFKSLAHELNANLPPCRELSMAITKLDQAMMVTNAGIARNKSFYEGRKHD